MAEILNLKVNAQDERYAIPVHLDGAEIPTFTVYFNPMNPYLVRYKARFENLISSKPKDMSEEDQVTELEAALDGIFGKGSCEQICQYIGLEGDIMNGIMAKVDIGLADFRERSKNAKIQAQGRAVIEARKSTEAYAAPARK
jgi:hypothetical protein